MTSKESLQQLSIEVLENKIFEFKSFIGIIMYNAKISKKSTALLIQVLKQIDEEILDIKNHNS